MRGASLLCSAYVSIAVPQMVCALVQTWPQGTDGTRNIADYIVGMDAATEAPDAFIINSRAQVVEVCNGTIQTAKKMSETIQRRGWNPKLLALQLSPALPHYMQAWYQEHLDHCDRSCEQQASSAAVSWKSP